MHNFCIIPIKHIEQENELTKTFYFAHALSSKPGQFVMLWLPGIGQKPFAIADSDSNGFCLTIVNRGRFTRKLLTEAQGTPVGIAGPYGNHFANKPNCHYVMLAGGYGVAPLYYLAKTISKDKNNYVDFCFGAKTAASLILQKKLQMLPNCKLHLATDDGSYGYRGNVTDLLPSLFSSLHHDQTQQRLIVACGPELMLKAVLQFCNQYAIPCQISLERYIKCGVGVCGQCAVDNNGLCICREGPIVSRQVANQVTELGQYAHDACGCKKYFITKE